jgi:hypothetical protein
MTLAFTADGLPVFYVLDEHNKPVAATLEEYGAWMEANDQQLARDKVHDVVISTVFLGVDMQSVHLRGGEPVVFETMVLCSGNPVLATRLDRASVRYCHYANALEGHRAVVEFIRSALNKEPE